MPIISYVPKKVAIKDRRNSDGGYYIAKCDNCNIEFYPKRTTAKYCSPECMRRAWHIKHKKEISEGTVKPKTVKQKVNEPLILIASGIKIANYFLKWRLKSYVYEFITKLEIGEEYSPVWKDDDNKIKYKVLGKYSIKRISQNKYELYEI